MADTPVISVVTIVYNDLKGLKKTFNSIVDQSYENFEYLVIDGGSKDGTREFIEENQRVLSYWVSEKDDGIADAFNKGVKAAKGEWILFLNSGDYFHSENTLKDVASILMKEDKRDVIYGKITLVDENENNKGNFGKPFNQSSFHREMTIPHQAAFHNRNIYKKVGFYDPIYKYCMDYELLLRIKDPNFLFVDQIISNMLIGGISQQSPKEVYKEFNKVKALHLNLPSSRLRRDLYENILRYRLSKLKQRILKS